MAQAFRYARRTPESTALHQLVSEHLDECLAQACERSEHGFGYPGFVEREFRAFLDCGDLRHGFVRVRCAHCRDDKLVGFSCKRRGICPSCTARRMSATAAHLVDHVLPAVPYRQWVLSFPKRIRFLLARDARLLSRVLRAFLGKVSSWQRRQARRLGIGDGECGAVTFVQRFGSLLNLNCHFHSLVPDGVFVERDGVVQFVSLPPPTPEELATLVGQIGRVTENYVAQALHSTDDDGPDALAQEQARSLQAGSFPRAESSVSRRQGLSAFLQGYSLHAARTVDSDDREALERLCRYGARAPIANSRLSIDGAGRAVVELKRPYFDGRTQLVLEPLALLRRLATLIPPPWKNLTRYHGVFGPAHRWRRDIVLAGAPVERSVSSTAPTRPPSRTRRLRWAELLRRVFALDVLRCGRCRGPVKILAAVTKPEAVEAILTHLARHPASNRSTGPPPSPTPPVVSR
jgi:hypothetical protein